MIEGDINIGDSLVLSADLFVGEEFVAVSGFSDAEGERRYFIIGSTRPDWWRVHESKLRAEARRPLPDEVRPVSKAE